MKQLLVNGSTFTNSWTWPDANGRHDAFWNHGRDFVWDMHYSVRGTWIVHAHWKLLDGSEWYYPAAIEVDRDTALALYNFLLDTPSPPFATPFLGLNYNRLIRPRTLTKWTAAELLEWESHL